MNPVSIKPQISQMPQIVFWYIRKSSHFPATCQVKAAYEGFLPAVEMTCLSRYVLFRESQGVERGDLDWPGREVIGVGEPVVAPGEQGGEGLSKARAPRPVRRPVGPGWRPARIAV